MFSSLCSAEFVSAASLCIHSVSRCDWFVASSHEFDDHDYGGRELPLKIFKYLGISFVILFSFLFLK